MRYRYKIEVGLFGNHFEYTPWRRWQWLAKFDAELHALCEMRRTLFTLETSNDLPRLAPEGCVLVAYDTGDGWALAVEDERREVVAYLAWPKAWPESLSANDLRAIGFEVV